MSPFDLELISDIDPATIIVICGLIISLGAALVVTIAADYLSQVRR